jgi:hypothetical protein
LEKKIQGKRGKNEVSGEYLDKRRVLGVEMVRDFGLQVIVSQN